MGESILLDRGPINRKPIPDRHTGAFQRVAEVIEAKKKPSIRGDRSRRLREYAQLSTMTSPFVKKQFTDCNGYLAI
ncbi:MAG: hypothetical protein HOH38_10940 [Nitrospinaceae bacterium]|nr:hypothetical protein [Nitrospinaceae bacterium]